MNASTLSQTGANCHCDGPGCEKSPEFQSCKSDVHQAYIVATAAAGCLSSGLMGLVANMPLGLAPGIGVNAYFALTIVGVNGNGLVPYGKALAAVWLEGWIFFILSLFGVRQWLARLLPASLKLSAGAGIGLYLAFVGLGPQGLNVIGLDFDNIIGLAGCPDQYAKYPGEAGACMSHVLQDPKVWVGIFLGGVLIGLLMVYRVRGCLLYTSPSPRDS